MPYNPSNYGQKQRGELDYLFEALGIRELFERVADLDSGDGPMDDVEENPTNDPAVRPNMEGVGTYSGGPNAENEASLEVLDPGLIKRIKEEAKEQETEQKKASRSWTSPSSTDSTDSKTEESTIISSSSTTF